MIRPISKRALFLVFSDAIAIAITYWIGFNLRFESDFLRLFQIPFFYLSEMVLLVLLYIFDLHNPFKVFKPAQTLAEIILSIAIGSIILAAVSYVERTFISSRLAFVYMSLSLLPLIFGIRLFYDYLFHSRMLDKKALVIGTGPLAVEITRAVRETPYSGIEVVGLVQEERNPDISRSGSIPIVGSLENLLSLIDWYKIQLAILALGQKHESSETSLMYDLFKQEIPVTSALSLFETLQGEIPYHVMDSHYLLGLMTQVKSKPYLKFKRLIDILASLLLLGFLSPILFVTMLVLRITSGGAIFFIQERIGKEGKAFRLIKFRTMNQVQKGKLRVTAVGKWIRRYRIDEIPQLINVLKGDMSLIGPRPEIPYFVNRSRKRIPFYDAVFTVKPGLTGWAQVKFRHVTSLKDYDKKFRYNLFYLKNVSLALDLIILLKTIRVVLLGDGK